VVSCLGTNVTFPNICVSQGAASLVRAREGSSAELSCSLAPTSSEATTPSLFPLHVVEWVRLGYSVPVLIKFGVYAPRVHPNYKGRVSLTRGASLLIERLTLEDEGWFECRILLLESKTDDFRNGTWTFLSITAPPVFIKTPPTFVEVLLGDSLTLSCGAHGNPRPTVVWHKDESLIEKHEKIKVLNGSLSLASVTRNISGVYKCHVSNSEGNLTHYTQLQVKGPPIILISPEDTTLNMSQDAVLQCQADAYPSNLTYEWLKQGQNVYHIESLKSRVKVLVDGTLLIPNLIPEDAGNYTCIPTNGILSPPSASAHLKVKHPARVGRMLRETYLPVGMEGVIVCPVQADPPVLYVNWTKDGNVLNPDNYPGWMVNSEGSVFIATANDNAVGMYTCTPYNSYGSMGQSEPTRVILKDPPSFRVPPRPEYFQEVGRELIIPCEASGDPAPNAKPTAQSPKMSPLQTSAILEYLSLPGFIEMSVDEPVEEVTDSKGENSELKPEKSVVAKPDVVPKNWEVHVQENRETGSNQEAVCFKQTHSAGAAEASFDTSKKQDYGRSRHGEARVRFPDDPKPFSPGPEKTSKQLYDEKTKIQVGNKSTYRPESRLGSRSAYTLFSAAKGMADIVSKHSQSFVDSSESLSEQSQRQASQGSRTNNIVSRINQAPVPFLKKSLSMGPCRTLSGMGQPRPFLKKSISLGPQRWEHFESPRTYISERCYWDEFPNPDVRVKSYSLGRTPPSLPRPGPSWREYVPFRRPSMGSLERPHHAQRSLASPSYLTPAAYPPRQTSVSPLMEPSDPRRQATVFPESSRWSPTCPEALRSVQHKYVPMPSSILIPHYQHQHWAGSRGDGLKPMDSRRGPPRSYLPRGISWPSPYYAPFPPREGEIYRQPDRMMGRGGETEIREGREIREGGRASYASQSSGRGSAGLFRQSLSITPTLLSSPETTEENERHRADMDLPERRAKR
uniref:Protein turtle homolog A-like n=1 Tax=Neolamprologus brichardi TaxID=32507 RepID=A0A3Q4N081_NEOBR